MYVTINDPDVEHWVKIFTRIDFDPNVNRIYMVYRLSKFKVPMYHNLIISTSSSHILTNNKDLLQGENCGEKRTPTMVYFLAFRCQRWPIDKILANNIWLPRPNQSPAMAASGTSLCLATQRCSTLQQCGQPQETGKTYARKAMNKLS